MPAWSLAAQPLFAHTAGTLLDLPLDPPFWLLLGAGAVVATGGTLSHRDAADQHPPTRRVWPASRRAGRVAGSTVVRAGLRSIGALAGAFVLALALFGPSGADRNPLTRLLLILVWGGIVPLSLLLGPFYRHVNPLRPLAAAVARGLDMPPRLLPPRIGRLPAAAGVIVVALSQFGLDALLLLRVGVLLHVGVHVFCGARFGPSWFPRGDPFEALSDVVGGVALAGPDPDRRLGLRDPVVAAATAVLPGTVAFAGMLVGASWFESVEDIVTIDNVAVAIAGTAIAAVLGTGVLRCGVVRDFLRPAVLPLAAAYGLQLYTVPLLLDGRIALSQLSDPFGRAAHLPELVARGVRLPVPAAIVAAVLFAAFVALHMVSIVLAHRAALARFDLRGARAVQFPMRAVVLASVVLGLWLPTLGGG